MSKKVNVTISILPEIAALSKKKAAENGLTRSQLIELLLRQWLDLPYQPRRELPPGARILNVSERGI